MRKAEIKDVKRVYFPQFFAEHLKARVHGESPKQGCDMQSCHVPLKVTEPSYLWSIPWAWYSTEHTLGNFWLGLSFSNSASQSIGNLRDNFQRFCKEDVDDDVQVE